MLEVRVIVDPGMRESRKMAGIETVTHILASQA